MSLSLSTPPKPLLPRFADAPGVRPDPLAEARALLRAAVAAPELITRLPLARKAGGYARTFLSGDTERSVWAFVWEPGATTPIHDHHCACCFAILEGQLAERWFSATSDHHAVLTQEINRDAGYMACLTPSGPNIHQMVNTSDKAAISLHVYGFDKDRRASSVDREYTRAAL